MSRYRAGSLVWGGSRSIMTSSAMAILAAGLAALGAVGYLMSAGKHLRRSRYRRSADFALGSMFSAVAVYGLLTDRPLIYLAALAGFLVASNDIKRLEDSEDVRPGTGRDTRTPDSHEAAMLRALLAEEFPGNHGLRLQARHARVKRIDENGSLRIFVPDDVEDASVARRIPVEAELPDTDDVMIHVLLHVVDGKLHELEIYRDDSQRVLRSFDLTS